MSDNSSVNESETVGEPGSDREPWYGGPDDSVMRTVMNMTPGLRCLVRQLRRAAGIS